MKIAHNRNLIDRRTSWMGESEMVKTEKQETDKNKLQASNQH
jgi:hypothetical protein